MARKQLKIYKSYLVVSGNGDFPLDMLRYDQCCPNNWTDMSALKGEEFRESMLSRYSMSGKPADKDRWRSFGWIVVSEYDAETGDNV